MTDDCAYQGILLRNYGPAWRAHRRITAYALSSSAVANYQVVQADMAALLCSGLLNSPETYYTQIRLLTGRIIMKVLYGVFVESPEESVRDSLTYKRFHAN
jgi:cytochrome P450